MGKGNLAILTVFLSFQSGAVAFEIPKWFSEPVSEDEQNYYGVGVGEDYSDSLALKLASEEALSDLVKTNLGFDFSEKADFYSDLDSVRLQKRSFQATALLNLSDIRVTKTERREKENGNSVYFIQRSIPKSLINKIKVGLSSAGPKEDKLMQVSINSSPKGAVAAIDGRKIGNTPVNVFLPPGKHILVLNLVGHEQMKKTLYLEAETDYSFDVPLKMALGKLRLQVDQDNVEIELRREGESIRTDLEELPPGTYQLSIRKDGFNDFRKTITINPYRTLNLDVVMVKAKKTKSQIIQENYESFYQLAGDYYSKSQKKELLLHMNNNFNPEFTRSSSYYFYLGAAQIENGQLHVGIANLKKSQALQNDGGVLAELCKAHYLALEYHRAIKYCDQSLNMASYWVPLYYKSESYFRLADENSLERNHYVSHGLRALEALVNLEESYKDQPYVVCSRYPYKFQSACNKYQGRY